MPRAPDLAGPRWTVATSSSTCSARASFGRVYRGRDRRLGRVVAVKVIKPWWAEDDAWVERFEREARLLARVSDPGIVRIYDIGEAEEGPYYVTELVEGESLADRLRRGPLPVAEARAVAEQLCRALGGAHAQGVVHCDVKPANVLLGADGRVRVGDFGVARLAEGTSQALTATVAGTPALHVARAGARRADDRGDRRLQRRRRALRDARRRAAVRGRLAGRAGPAPPPGPAAAAAASVPAPLRAVVERALAKRPRERYGDAAQMADALRATGLGAAAIGAGLTAGNERGADACTAARARTAHAGDAEEAGNAGRRE